MEITAVLRQTFSKVTRKIFPLAGFLRTHVYMSINTNQL